MLYDEDIWPLVPLSDRWIFDKLLLSCELGHISGPPGVDVPKPDVYVVRPCVNLMGMGLGMQFCYIEKETDDLPPGHFWQEVFVGDHLSIDYYKGELLRCTRGEKHEHMPQRFTRWTVIDHQPEMPAVVEYFIDAYPQVNVETIGGKVIEVHLRGNPDFDDGAVEIIPVWKDSDIQCPQGFTWVADPDGDRLGFYKRYEDDSLQLSQHQ